MLSSAPSSTVRELHSTTLTADLAVVGGGLAGVCAAISAARAGIQVVLIQDRPVLGGNSSSEVRLWGLGATSHMSNNNRWAREGGLVDELLVENIFRNREGNALLWDALLLEKVSLEPNLTVVLNTAVDGMIKDGPSRIEAVTAYCSQSQTRTTVRASLFCDASGDGIVGFQAGAAFRMGAEKPDEFGEGLAPDDSYGELLGHSIYFYSKDTGHPVKYVPPDFALKDITKIPRFRNISAQLNGLKFWWIEYGGRRDTIHETEEIKWELWKVVYGIWDYIKNSGKFPEAETMTLEWVGTIPGKRESRRFEGDIMLTQRDIVEQRRHPDAVAAGGWSIDLHPSDGIYSDRPPCNQYHGKGVYQIPYRCYLSRNIDNLFLAGRIISASHVAFGSTRVMLTGAHGGTAVGMAAAQCLREDLQPRDLLEPAQMARLQADLNRTGQAIPGIPSDQSGNLAAIAKITATSTLKLAVIPADQGWRNLDFPIAQLLPFEPDSRPEVTLRVRSEQDDTLRAVLRTSERPANTTPDLTLEEQTIELQPGEQTIHFRFGATVPSARYAFICLYGNKGIEIPTSAFRCTGLVSVEQKFDKAVAEANEQSPPPGLGIDRFEFWIPTRRPGGHNIALRLDPPLNEFASPDYLTNGFERPWLRTNAWIADPADPNPTLTLNWEKPVTFRELDLHFDTDFDHSMETTHLGHPEDVMPFCVRDYTIRTMDGTTVHQVTDNHQTINRVRLETPLTADQLIIELNHPSPNTPAALFGLYVR
jgi:hypothetical protein